MKNFFLNIAIHYYIKSFKIRVAISAGSALLYIFLFFPLFLFFGPSTGAFATIPVVITGGLLGFWMGIISSILAFPVSTILLNMSGIPGWNAIFAYGGGPPMMALVVIGAIVGLLHDLAERVREELLERKEAEEALRKSEERNRAIFDVLPDTLFQLDKDGFIRHYKESKHSPLGTDAAGIRGKNLNDILPKDMTIRFMYYMNQALNTGSTQVFRFHITEKDADRHYDARIIVSGQDEVLFIVRDITEQYQVEEAKKKDLLLKEIHHRVKNNLQIISSLLYLQSRYIHDQEDLKAFQESQDRIKTMSLIHERLYQSKDLTRIDFSDYLQALTLDLFYSYGINPEIIKLETQIETFSLEIDVAIPCGLIINELLLNAIKYAFPGHRQGIITIRFFSREDESPLFAENGTLGKGKTYTLIISDNGVGMPAGFDFEGSQTLGLKLVRTLVDQMKGTINIDGTNGTCFTITFYLSPIEVL
jgi:PAS domain S-box-containing protein